MIVRANATTAVVVRSAPTTWGSGFEVVDLVSAATREHEALFSGIVSEIITSDERAPIDWRSSVIKETRYMN